MLLLRLLKITGELLEAKISAKKTPPSHNLQQGGVINLGYLLRG